MDRSTALYNELMDAVNAEDIGILEGLKTKEELEEMCVYYQNHNQGQTARKYGVSKPFVQARFQKMAIAFLVDEKDNLMEEFLYSQFSEENTFFLYILHLGLEKYRKEKKNTKLRTVKER